MRTHRRSNPRGYARYVTGSVIRESGKKKSNKKARGMSQARDPYRMSAYQKRRLQEDPYFKQRDKDV
jgi:hypothetical protein